MTTVSVVIPCYNYGHFLEDAVTSVLDEQEGVDVRVLVIDAEEAPPRGSNITGINAPSIAKPYGVITSSAFSPRLKQAVALAFIRREILVGTKAEVIWDRGPSVCTIEKPPLEQ